MQLIQSRCTALTLFASLYCMSLPASFAADEVIDEIVVTADLRGRSSQEIPASVSILDAEVITGIAVQHFEELIGTLPNLNWSGDGHRARYLQIRGVGELAQYQGAPNPSVGFIIDDIDFSGIGSIATLYDIDRVEVLRGPQGTRYGANALAGLIYMQSADPGDEFSGNLRLVAGDDHAFGAGIAIGGPLGESGYRVSANHYESDGFRRNPYLGRNDTNGRDETSVRARLVWGINRDWAFKATGMLTDVNDGYDAFAIDNSLTVLSDKPGKDAQKSIGGSLRADWSGAKMLTLTSITSIADSEIDFSFDADWGNDVAWAPITYDYVSLNDRQRRTLSQEIRVTSKDEGRVFSDSTGWLFGVYINRMDEDLATMNLGEYIDPGINFADSLDDRLDSRFEASNLAVFGQLDFEVGEDSRLAFGGRVERRLTNYIDSTDLRLDPSETMFGGEIAWSHRFNEQTNGYVTLSRGFKAGGFNLGLVPAGRREFVDESMWNIEAGIKGSLANGRLHINSAVFYSERIDQQVEISFQLIPNDPASFGFLTTNAEKGTTIGLETELQWLVGDSLEIYASLGLLKAEFDEFSDYPGIVGREQAHAPNYTAAIGGVYRHKTGFFARVDVSAKSDFYFDVTNDQQSRSYSITNARVGYELDRWTAQLWLRNAFDEHYAVRGFYFGNEPPDFSPALYIRQGDPRQIGLTFDRRF